MTASRWRALFGVTPCVAVVVAGLGCSSSDFQTAPAGDGGATEDTGGGGTDGGTDTTKPMCIVPPAATGTETDFCNFEAALYSRCGHCEACRQNNVNACVQFGEALSASFKSALIGCKDALACGDYASLASDKCVQGKIAVATPTPAQASAKDAYCAACPANANACKNFFDFAGGDAGPDAGPRGIGAMVMYSSDDIAKAIADACKGGLNCDPGIYQLCAVGKFCSKTPPDDCKSGFCGK